MARLHQTNVDMRSRSVFNIVSHEREWVPQSGMLEDPRAHGFAGTTTSAV